MNLRAADGGPVTLDDVKNAHGQIGVERGSGSTPSIARRGMIGNCGSEEFDCVLNNAPTHTCMSDAGVSWSELTRGQGYRPETAG